MAKEKEKPSTIGMALGLAIGSTLTALIGRNFFPAVSVAILGGIGGVVGAGLGYFVGIYIEKNKKN